MNRTIEMLCLIDLGRSRVISGHSRDIGCPIFWIYGILDYAGKEKNLETERGKVKPVCVG